MWTINSVPVAKTQSISDDTAIEFYEQWDFCFLDPPAKASEVLSFMNKNINDTAHERTTKTVWKASSQI